jgi:hypothetical protein
MKRKDCGKKEEIEDFSSITPHQTEKMLQEKECGRLGQCPFCILVILQHFDDFSVSPVF